MSAHSLILHGADASFGHWVVCRDTRVGGQGAAGEQVCAACGCVSLHMLFVVCGLVVIRLFCTAADVTRGFAVSLETVLAGHENWVYGVHWQPPVYEGTRWVKGHLVHV